MCLVKQFERALLVILLFLRLSNGLENNKNFLTDEDKRGALNNELDAKIKRDLPVSSSKRYYGDYESNRYGGSGSGYSHTGLGNYGDDRRPSSYYDDDYHHSGGGGYLGNRPTSYGSGYGPPPPGPIYHGGYEEDHYYPHHDYGGGEKGGIMGDYKSLTLKKILLPLAGLAILGVAAAASHNPVLLPLGTLNGRKKRSLPPPNIYPVNPHVRPNI